MRRPPLTFREVLEQLRKLSETQPELLDKPVTLEGCDCTGECTYVQTEADQVFLGRD